MKTDLKLPKGFRHMRLCYGLFLTWFSVQTSELCVYISVFNCCIMCIIPRVAGKTEVKGNPSVV
jgi:hypothetical protein